MDSSMAMVGVSSVREVSSSTTLANAPPCLQPATARSSTQTLRYLALGQPRTRHFGNRERWGQTFSTRNAKKCSLFPFAPKCALVDHQAEVKESEPESPSSSLQPLIAEFSAIKNSKNRLARLLEYASRLPRMSHSKKAKENRVMGCSSQVWLASELGSDGNLYFEADSDSELTRGFCACLIQALSGTRPQEILSASLDSFSSLLVGMPIGETPSRINTWSNLLISMQKRAQIALSTLEGNIQILEPFPSLLISASNIQAQGSFAVAQVNYLSPDETKVRELVGLLKEKQIGIVAHFYMDPEVQGVLVAAQKFWPHIHISDSLVMADRAVKMADAGCKSIAVLGVDFMSENVRAILDEAGHGEVDVYRMSTEKIGCSLAEAADSDTYLKYLEAAAERSPALHVIYINTSLETKARAQALVPTITCTSSNVVQTILQAFSQVPDLTVWYGPDSYMGANLVALFNRMGQMSDGEIAEIHPLHNKKSIASLLPRLHFFTDGTCIVHDLFGQEVVTRVRNRYSDAFLTAHFEVPGEMFNLAIGAQARDMGVIGSTQNILDFITSRVRMAVKRGFDDHLQFILGTESGMVTSIVNAVRNILNDSSLKTTEANIEVEIVFPVSSDAISTTSSSSSDPSGNSSSSNKFNLSNLSIVPGVSSGEGCSLSGGCASCPYMKMNSLDALLRVCHIVGTPSEALLVSQQARRLKSSQIAGYNVAELGCKPILHMRCFQANGRLPEELVNDILK